VETARPVRLGIVNDYELVVRGTAALLAPYDDRVRVVELASLEPVVSHVDVLLYDTFGQLQGDRVDLAGLTADRASPVVVFSWNTDPSLVARALGSGAAGYISKSVSAEELVELIERVYAGERVAPAPHVPEGDGFGRWPGQEAGLSSRESEILGLITQGLSNEEILERAFISKNTLKTHVRSIYRKLGVTRRTQAVVWGHAHGFVPTATHAFRPDVDR
jgi:two-component system, NarL family, response regulator LiaR